MISMTASKRQGGHPGWDPKFYPITVDPDWKTVPIETSYYGKANPETLAIFQELQPGARVLDVGGGDGQIAFPLAQDQGFQVDVMDIDELHLAQLVKRAALLTQGKLTPIQFDAFNPYDFVTKPEQPGGKDSRYDAVLNAGFGYLFPPEKLEAMFRNMADAMKPGGLMVWEFSTERFRLDHEETLLPEGGNVQKYSLQQGKEILRRLYSSYGIELAPMIIKPVAKVTPDYVLHSTLITAHGRKQ